MIMKKNYFGKFIALAMFFGLAFGMQSCGEYFDNPTGPTTPTEEEEVGYPDGITITESGATFGISSLADISKFLEEIKTEISEKAGAEFVIDIAADGDLATSDSENTIEIPDLSDYNITLNLKSKLSTSAVPLTVKQAGEATSTYKNKINLNLANDDVDLVLDVPGTTATLNKLNSLQILNGMSIVKTGGEIKTWVWAPVSNDYWLNDGDSEWVKVSIADGEEMYQPNVQPEGGDGQTSYKFKNLKIVKGKADYAKVSLGWDIYGLDKLTIAEGATVVLNYYPYVKEIIGEGNGAILTTNDIWWGDEEKKEAQTDFNFYETDKISNVTIEPFLEGDFKGATISYSYIYQSPANLENCTIKFSRIDFRDSQSASATVKECKFVGSDDEKQVYIIVPYQTEEITGFKFSFDNCEFAKDCRFLNGVNTSKPILDENGDQVYKYIYRWWTFTEDGYGDWNYWNRSESLDDVPEANQEIGETEGGWTWEEGKSLNGYSTGYWIEKEAQFEDATFKDYYIYVSFTECKIDGAALTSENITISNSWVPSGAYLRYEFDGKTYRALWDSENEKYLLIEAN